MKLRVVVVGIPGVGKTTVLDKLSSRLDGARLVTFGSVMLEEAKRRKWVKERDEMRRLPVGRQRQLQGLAAARIARMADDVVLVDTHLFIRTREGFWPGLPYDVVRALKPTHLVLVEASPEEVSARRAADGARSRDAMTREELVEEAELGRSFLTVSSTLTGAPMLIVKNPEGRAESTADQLASLIRDVAK